MNKQEIYNLITKTLDRYDEDEKITEDEYLDILVKIRDLTEEYSADLLSINYHLRQELDQYKNNWEELKKAVKQIEKDVKNGITEEYLTTLDMTEKILNKMKELEEDKKCNIGYMLSNGEQEIY